MSGLGFALAAGFGLGLRHATDADHVVAISTLIVKLRKRSAAFMLGAFWGIGHTLTVSAVGAAVILMRVSVPPQLAERLELAVGLMLVILGIANMLGKGLGSWTLEIHSHPHKHGDHPHQHFERKSSHEHLHAHSAELERVNRWGRWQAVRSFAVGMVHGLAGSTATALLVLATIRDPWAGLLYLAVFGMGSLLGMAVISLVLESALLWLVERVDVARQLTFWTGLVSLAFGLYIMYINILGELVVFASTGVNP